jgi:hypothetical protein
MILAFLKMSVDLHAPTASHPKHSIIFTGQDAAWASVPFQTKFLVMLGNPVLQPIVNNLLTLVISANTQQIITVNKNKLANK